MNLASYAKFSLMRDAIAEAGRPMVFSFEPYGLTLFALFPDVSLFLFFPWRAGDGKGDIWVRYAGLKCSDVVSTPQPGAVCETALVLGFYRLNYCQTVSYGALPTGRLRLPYRSYGQCRIPFRILFPMVSCNLHL